MRQLIQGAVQVAGWALTRLECAAADAQHVCGHDSTFEGMESFCKCVCARSGSSETLIDACTMRIKDSWAMLATDELVYRSRRGCLGNLAGSIGMLAN